MSKNPDMNELLHKWTTTSMNYYLNELLHVHLKSYNLHKKDSNQNSRVMNLSKIFPKKRQNGALKIFLKLFLYNYLKILHQLFSEFFR